MAKPNNPLFGFDARGTLAKILTFRLGKQQTIAETKPFPQDAKTSAQLAWRTMYQLATDMWHALSPLEQQQWEGQARFKNMTGYAWFMSKALKPNPGIYLPLSGGTMKGIINTDTYAVINLPAPATDAEPARKIDLTTQIATHAALTSGAHSFDKSCRVFQAASSWILTGLWSSMGFSVENWDTDNIWTAPPSTFKLTCKTAGKYLIQGGGAFEFNATGQRGIAIRLNGTTWLTMPFINAVTTSPHGTGLNTSCLWNMAVNDYVELQFYQNSGVSLQILSLVYYSPFFSMARIA